jgi:PAS domain S-box-containing protein
MSNAVSILDQRDFELIAESIPHIVWLASADGSTEYFNRRGSEYTGLPPETNYGWEWLSLIHPDDVERARSEWDLAFTSGEPQELEYRIRRYDGEYRWMAVRGTPAHGSDGEILKWIGTCTDIDDEKRTQRTTAEILTLLETLLSTAPVGFGFVDREYRYVRVNERLAAMNGQSIDSHIGRTVAEVVPDLWPNLEPLYVGIVSTGTPVLDLEVAGETAAEPGRMRNWFVNLYPVRIAAEIIGIGIVVVDITERKEAERSRSELMRAAVGAIAATIEARDPYTSGHEQRVAEISGAIAGEMGLAEDEIEGIMLTASIHDIGKIAVPAEILSRPGALHPAEFELIKQHSVSGAHIVAGIRFPWPVAEMILHHHERFDGSGYPSGLRGEQILLGARIIAVADVLEAMSSHRPYRASRGLDAALAELEQGGGTLFDPAVVDVCLRLVAEGRVSVGDHL